MSGLGLGNEEGKGSDQGVMQVIARNGVVIATGCPITKNLVDSAVTAIAVHGKQYPRRRCVATAYILSALFSLYHPSSSYTWRSSSNSAMYTATLSDFES